MREPVFLDSGIFIAFLNAHDQFHEQAATLFTISKPRWFTSYLVLSEVYSWFLHRHGEEAARFFRRFVDELEGLQIFDINKHHHQQALAMLDRLHGSKLTYVDASSLCFIERHKIRKVWSTDHHLALTGAQVLPRAR